MFVCMFYLSPRSRIIVSIWETSETTLSKRERKKEEEQEAEVWSLRYKQLRILYSLTCLRKFLLLYFFVFIFYLMAKGLLRSFCVVFLENFCFFSFSFFSSFLTTTKVSLCETCKYGSDLSYSICFGFCNSLQRNTWRFAPRRFVCLFFTSRGFLVGVSPSFSNFRAKVSRLLLALPEQKEKCVLLRTFVPV